MLPRWGSPNGYRHVLAVSLPLVASWSSQTVMQFTDRMFLSNYSVEAIAAATPAGIVSFMFVSFFLGVATYVNTFIAQYVGAQAPHRVGAALWQGVYFCLLAGLLLAALYLLADPIFLAASHPLQVRGLEVTYFQILTLGGVFALLPAALATFYSGRGLTNTIMLVTLAGALFNIPLDYALINGVWGLPEMGIAGAALATVAAGVLMTALYAALIFTGSNQRRFGVLSGWRPDWEIFRRLMRYGLPSGVEFFVEMMAFTAFVLILGRLGTNPLAASNIAFSIYHVAFMPMIGFHIAVSTLVGQAIGARQPAMAMEATTSALHITLLYMCSVSAVFLLAPHWLMELFRTRGPDNGFSLITSTGVVLLRLVALYSLFDALNLIYAGALKGAGDTRFIMWTISSMALGLMALPSYVVVEWLNGGLYAAWGILTAYVSLVALVFWGRYRKGKWKGMRVIEESPAA